jgi:hypothetical protein
MDYGSRSHFFKNSLQILKKGYKMKKKKYHTIRTVPKSNRKIVENDKIETFLAWYRHFNSTVRNGTGIFVFFEEFPD